MRLRFSGDWAVSALPWAQLEHSWPVLELGVGRSSLWMVDGSGRLYLHPLADRSVSAKIYKWDSWGAIPLLNRERQLLVAFQARLGANMLGSFYYTVQLVA